MVDTEFDVWVKDFRSRFPDIGSWMADHPETMKIWLGEVFSKIQLQDCLAANKLLLADHVGRFDRERLPALIRKYALDLAWERAQASKQKAADAVRSTEAQYKRPFDAGMRAAMRALEGWQEDFKIENNRRCTDVERRTFVDQWFAEHDRSDPTTNEPWFKCNRCLDTGQVSYRDEKARPYVGHCDCEKGLSERDRFFAAKSKKNGSGVFLGPAVTQERREAVQATSETQQQSMSF